MAAERADRTYLMIDNFSWVIKMIISELRHDPQLQAGRFIRKLRRWCQTESVAMHARDGFSTKYLFVAESARFIVDKNVLPALGKDEGKTELSALDRDACHIGLHQFLVLFYFTTSGSSILQRSASFLTNRFYCANANAR
ncbi:hypothetical protein A5904_16255 (plasmid) [Acidithiobacillus caldus]|uniref:hypothetical protein n=1 Tax=Acidithiobacillus caldus TaxID=33059 RepID=UPI0011D191C8|nr:hypothetical protein [Acidithiobacillus caldus]QEM40787.1 hypothetical protein A5904_16255 [Acidithiobacillus caldus]